jgi:hypothetical protein
MTKNNLFSKAMLAGATLLTAATASAVSLDWTGAYRIEYVNISNTSLDSSSNAKDYLLNSLTLSPKIIAADGVNIVSKFQILPNKNYPNSQLGEVFGNPAPTHTNGATGGSSTEDSAVAGDSQTSVDLQVDELYLNVNQEFGALVVGRAPLDFGLGMSYSAGNGAFDHWHSSLDQVGYKVILGNLSIMPIVGRSLDMGPGQGGASTDMILNADYNNPETDSEFAIFYHLRQAGTSVNDAPRYFAGGSGIIPGSNEGTNAPPNGTTSWFQDYTKWSSQQTNIYIARGFDHLKIKVEGGFQSGNTGVVRTDGNEVKLAGYGIATEVSYAKPDSKWAWNFRQGIASGDNPSTANFEGFYFHRNYDIAFMLFNHPLGRYDLLRSYGQRGTQACTPAAGTGSCPVYSTDQAMDDETISNAIYISPKVTYRMSDKWDWMSTLTWAEMQTNPLADQNIDVSKDLGFELDTGFTFRPTEKILWVNEFGFLFPGSAFKGGSLGYGARFSYGFTSKAAISF